MKLKSVSIDGLHRIDSKTYDFDEILTYLHGKNAAGKTTIINAIQLGILGYIPGTNKANTAIFSHANKSHMSVLLKFDDNGQEVTILREWAKFSGSIRTNVETTPSGFDFTSCIKDIELPVFNFNDFISLTANKLKDWFIEFLPNPSVDIDWKDELSSCISDEEQQDEAVEKYIDDCVKRIEASNLSGMDQIRYANTMFKGDLSYLKSERDRNQSTVKSLIYYDDADESISGESIESEILELNARLSAINKYNSIVSKNEAIRYQINELGIDADAKEEDDEGLANINKQIDELNKKLSDTNEPILNQKKLIDDVSKEVISICSDMEIYKKIVSMSDTCPILRTECDKLVSSVHDANDKLSELQKKLAEAETKREELINDSQMLADEQGNIIRNIRMLTDEANKIKANYARLQQLKALVQPVPDNVGASEDTEFILSRINELSELKSKVLANRRYSELMMTINKVQYETEKKIEYVNAWIKLTGVNGIQSNMNDQFTEFCSTLTKYVKVLFGETTESKFNIESKANSFSFGISRDGNYIPYDLLSSGEKCMYMLSMMVCLIAESKSSIKLLLVDDLLDHLDDTNIINLFESLYVVEGIQMIFAGVKEIDSELGKKVTKEI